MIRWVIALVLFSFLTGCVTPAVVPGDDAAVSPTLMLDTTPSAIVRATSTAVLSTSTPTAIPSPTLPAIKAEDQYAFSQLKRLGRGINLGNALEAPNEGEWGVVLQEDYFRLIKEAGFQSVRIPIRWSNHAAKDAPYTIDPEFFARVDWAIDQAIKNDLAVVINIHHYEELMDVPRLHHERFLALWQQIADHYKNAPETVMFELLNEPMGTLSGTSWNDFAAEAITVIRRTNPKRTIVVGPGNWNNVDALPELVLPEDDRNLIVTFHFYAPFAFTHQGAEWVTSAGPVGTQWNGTEAEKALLNIDFDLAELWGQKYRRPIYLGEFGAYNKADMDSRHRWTDFVARTAEDRDFGWAYWEFCAGFGAYDPQAGRWNEPILTALIPR
jgi:endoglucanase